MSNVTSLESLQATWTARASHLLARGEAIRHIFLEELKRFYNLLIQSVETGDPAWLEPVIYDWAEAIIDVDEGNHQEQALLGVIHVLMDALFQVSRECLSPIEAMDLTGVVLPVFHHAVEYAGKHEYSHRIYQVQAELEKTSRLLEQIDQSKSDFIAVAAHELKTPLTLIEGYTSMLKEVLPEDGKSPLVDIYVRGIDTGNHRLNEIINDMIDVSMIDNQLLAISFQPVWINRILNAARREVETYLVDRKQILVINTFPGADEMTYGDGERLLQAFRYVILNAIKYTPDGGIITIDGRKLPGFVETTITDTGIGIDPEDHQRIFEKFGRLGSVMLHSSSKVKFKGGGPGLGLPITKGIIEAHGGAIWVESEGYDEARCPGSIFHILLPLLSELPDNKSTKLFEPVYKAGVRNPQIRK